MYIDISKNYLFRKVKTSNNAVDLFTLKYTLILHLFSDININIHFYNLVKSFFWDEFN